MTSLIFLCFECVIVSGGIHFCVYKLVWGKVEMLCKTNETMC